MNLEIAIKSLSSRNRMNRPQACNFIKKEALAQVLSCEFCEISKNNFFTEHVWTAAFVVMTFVTET